MDVKVEQRADTPLGKPTFAPKFAATPITKNLFWENLFLLFRQHPHLFALVPVWLCFGVNRLKFEMARRTEIDTQLLPYNQDLARYIQQNRTIDERIVLTSQSPKIYANQAELQSIAHDVFEGSGDEKLNWRVIAKMLRVHQWLKNLLIFAPVLLAHAYGDVSKIVSCIIAFISFSAAASAIYIFNDFFDLTLDRAHPTKCKRPFANGQLSIPFGMGTMAVLLTLSFACAYFLQPMFALVLLGYLFLTTAYTISLKRMLLIDVLTLAGLYTVRLLAGSVATQTEGSFWLLAFSMFFFLSLALVKRFVELGESPLEEGERLAGRGYRVEDANIITQCGIASTFAAALVFALYIDSDTVRTIYAHEWMIWPLGPMLLYIMMRIWVLAHRKEMHDDPVVFLISDWRSLLVIALGGVLLLIAGAWPF